MAPDRVVVGAASSEDAERVAAPLRRRRHRDRAHRRRLGGDDQAGRERVPRHEDLVHQRDRERLRGGRRRRRRGGARAWASTGASARASCGRALAMAAAASSATRRCSSAATARRGSSTLAALHAEHGGADVIEPDGLEVLSWRAGRRPPGVPAGQPPRRRRAADDLVEVRTKMGRRVRVTARPPVRRRRPATGAVDDEAGPRPRPMTDWLPLAQGAAGAVERRAGPRRGSRGARAGIAASEIIVRLDDRERELVGALDLATRQTAFAHRRGSVTRLHDVVRCGAIRLDEAAALALDVRHRDARHGAQRDLRALAVRRRSTSSGRCSGCTSPRGTSGATAGASGSHGASTTRTRRISPSGSPRTGARSASRRTSAALPTTLQVSISSRILAALFDDLGLGRNAYEHAIPDLVWDRPLAEKRALLAGLWLGDGSWSYIQRGPSVVLEYGTVSRALADGMLRLLGDCGIVARLKVGARPSRRATPTGSSSPAPIRSSSCSISCPRQTPPRSAHRWRPGAGGSRRPATGAA